MTDQASAPIFGDMKRLEIKIVQLLSLCILAVDSSYEPHINQATFDPSLVSITEVGETVESLQLVFTYMGEKISPWHDLPFTAGTNDEGAPLLSFICEIPLGTREKMEIHKR